MHRMDDSSLKPYAPYLPKIPDKIYGQANCARKLTNRTENEWRFLFREIEDIPSPYSENQDYNFDSVAEDEWQNVIAPSSLLMQ